MGRRRRQDLPLAILAHEKAVDRSTVRLIMKALPTIVANNLQRDEGPKIGPEHVEVEARTFADDDIVNCNIRITVEADDCPSRLANLKERREAIQQALRHVVPTGLVTNVWVRLAPASFGVLST